MKTLLFSLLIFFPLLTNGSITNPEGASSPKQLPQVTFLIDGKPSTTCDCDANFKTLSIVVPISDIEAFEFLTVQLKNDEDFRPLANVKTADLKGKKELVFNIIEDEKSDFKLQLTKKYYFMKKNDFCYNKKGKALIIKAEARGHVLLSHQVGKPPIYDKGELLTAVNDFVLKRSPNFEQPEHNVATYVEKEARKTKAKEKGTAKKVAKFSIKNFGYIFLGVLLIIGIISGDSQ